MIQPSRRRVILINKRFQLRFAFYVCSWLIGLSFVYPLVLQTVTDYYLRQLALDPTGPDLAYLEKIRVDATWVLIWMQLAFLAMTFVISLFMSHRIAGPLNKLNNYLRQNRDGNYQPTIVFRKFDYFQEIAQTYNEMMSQMLPKLGRGRSQTQKAIDQLQKASCRK